MAGRFPQAKIVLTLGSKGSLYWDGEKILPQACYKVKAVDTTAAGDTFTGFSSAASARGWRARQP